MTDFWLNREQFALFLPTIEGTNGSTLAHDEYDWKRYPEYESLVKKPVREITYVDFVSWFKRKLKGGLLNRKTGDHKQAFHGQGRRSYTEHQLHNAHRNPL